MSLQIGIFNKPSSFMNKIVRISLFVICLLGCQSEQQQDEHMLRLVLPEESGLSFTNVLQESPELNIITFEYFYNGAGVGVGDFNRDGLQDLFFSSNKGENKLYLNQDNFQFEEITTQAGIVNSGKWATGVSIVDINQDGWPDIYVCFAGPQTDPRQRQNELYVNQQNSPEGYPIFREMAEEYRLADTGHSTMATFLDYDRDGDLDMYLLTNITDQMGPNVIRPKKRKGEMVNTDRLYRNDGPGAAGHPIYQNVSAEAGITIEGYGLGVSVVDINQDNWPDIYVSNDYLSNDLLYINNQNGTFSDKASEYFRHQSYSAMGNDVADFDNDALPDILTLDMLPPDNRRKKLMFGETNYNRYRSELQYGYAPQFMRNTLQWHRGFKPNGQAAFSEIGQLAGVEATDWSWSALWADMDMDGFRDLLVTNGYPRDITNRDFASYKMQEFSNAAYTEEMKDRFVEAINQIEGAHLPNMVFRNKADLSFENVSDAWGFEQPSYSTGAVYVDLDNDGDLDYVANNTNAPAFVYENLARENLNHHWLRLLLEGEEGNLAALGAKIWCYLPDKVLFAENYPYRGYQSTIDPRIHFGLGNAAKVDSLRIAWPSGDWQVLYDLKVDQQLSLKSAEATPPKALDAKKAEPAQTFVLANQKRNIHYKHEEEYFGDFNIQPLLPHKLSQQGPAVTVADVNGDGLEDFFVGGAFEQSGQIFIQQINGKFTSQPLSDTVKYEEDHGSIFFDADGDGDQDLYIVSGGNEFKSGSAYYQDRLYLNDGQGKFRLSSTALPMLNTASACVVAADYDHDGDLDLFIGGRHTPQQYPLEGTSYLLENQGGKFVDVTTHAAPQLKNAGMITSALWTDVDQDGWEDLMVVGEWMAPQIYQNQRGKLKKVAVPVLAELSGWWNSILGTDFDQDGDIDYVAGNLGLNSRYKADSVSPLQLIVSDFNRDQRIDAIMTYDQEGVTYPVHPRDDMLRQLNHLKRQYSSYTSFAEAKIEDIFSPQQLESAKWLESREMRSCYLENLGNFNFAVKPLPIEAQIGPVYGMLSNDFNQDSYPDLLLTGNSYATEVISGPYDALKGLLLLGDGHGNFQAVSPQSSGFWVDEDAKALTHLHLSDGSELILASQNNDSLIVYEVPHNSREYHSFGQEVKDASIYFKDGRQQKIELYSGSGYLSQSGRGIWFLPEMVKSIEEKTAEAQDSVYVHLNREK
ncbi:VCBS repeat-containing protein [Catalinimonas locisalis]|uniref:VCBS repeat-containing protein n=1 Tax=Catalinimonas locisalis TaxID=3133978 RepID=UPI0031018E08